MVAPLVGAWIEITQENNLLIHRSVAPLVGAWIEMLAFGLQATVLFVAPLVGAWIEIDWKNGKSEPKKVAPLVGAWIEICGILIKFHKSSRRSPCGSVD